MHYHYFTLEQRDALTRQIQGLMNDEENRSGVKTAIARLREPDYGVCEACGADIPYVRLLENPLLKRCARC